jgi:hypothetical protein
MEHDEKSLPLDTRRGPCMLLCLRGHTCT